MNKELINPSLIVKPFIKVIGLFKNRFDVQNGYAIGYRKNQDPNNEPDFNDTPKSIGYGLTTTGYCVSVSQALLLDKVFQELLKVTGSRAKLVSIDIKEQYYGSCYSGSQNKWHTGILVKSENYIFIIDMTCAQFGNRFVDKFIWDFKTWEETFRSATCKHIITDFDNNELSYLPLNKNNTLNNPIETATIINRLHDITTLTDDERKIISEFFVDKVKIINKKLIIGNINTIDFKYLTSINKLIENLNFKIYDDNTSIYSILMFTNKDSAKKWIDKFLTNDCILQEYLICSEKIDDNCKFFGINPENINIEPKGDTTYIVIEICNAKGIDVTFIDKINLCISYGIKLNIDIQTGIYNSGKNLSTSVDNIEKKTNTIYIKATN